MANLPHLLWAPRRQLLRLLALLRARRAEAEDAGDSVAGAERGAVAGGEGLGFSVGIFPSGP